jgi:16S rRNA (cytosine1402-N4)-methyltransferase
VTDDHQPVMVEEVVHFLAPRPEGIYVDVTVGAGGHAAAILRATGGRATVVGVDRDPHALARARYNLRPFGASVKLVGTDFSDLSWILASQDLTGVDGILADLGMSSMQVDDPARGFSFRREGPLDMRMDPSQRLTAADVVNSYSVEDLARILRTYGEERHAERIARSIVSDRRRGPIRSTTQLAELLEKAYPARSRRQHPARRTFQALRIEVNQEIRALEALLAAAPEVLNPGGRIVVISYHSLEDRLVKRVFAGHAGRGRTLPGLGAAPATGRMELLTPNAVLPAEAEVERNPRASSARLRAARLRRRPLSEGTA